MKPSVRLAGVLVSLFVVCLIATHHATGQQKTEQGREQIIKAAQELMIATRYCALITVDAAGRAHARTMDPFPPEKDLIVWLGTNPRSRKVAEIRRDARVTLYYFDAASQGYVTLYGRARLVDDPKEKARRWKEEWKAFYPDREKGYLLIAVTPQKLEVVIEKKGIVGNSAVWTPPSVTFPREKKRR